MSDPHVHLRLDVPADLDVLADVLAGEAEAPDCPTCAARLAELDAASGAVSAALRAVSAPELPADLAVRLDAALLAERSGTAGTSAGTAAVTTLPSPAERAARRSAPRWLPAAAAAVVLVAGGVVAAQSLPLGVGGGADTGTEAASDSAGPALVRNDSGNAYTQGNLAAAVPGILTGSVLPVAPPAAAGDASTTPLTGSSTKAFSGTGGTSGSGTRGTPEALAAAPGSLDRLRTTEGLAACLAALLPPDDESVQPLALDYGSFEGEPALLVVLPVPDRDDKLDVFVVGATCALEDEALLFFQRVDRPA